VLDKWFAVQAASSRGDTLGVVQMLAGHPQFDPRNPNRLRALALGFAGNQARFHDRDGAGYAWLAGLVLATDRINPQSAARLVGPFARWKRLMHPWTLLMREQLSAIHKTPGLSKDVTEVVASSICG
jgi:aminopeptidase N